jgi:hypothetical protein
MATKREKGKIAHAEWPAIVGRHAGGESMASIARSYGCTAPAIRYIVNRGTVRAAEGEGVSPGGGAVTAPAVTASRPSRAGAPPAERNHARSRADAGSSSPIDQTLRERVNSDIAAFLVAFDAAFAVNSINNRAALREATDRLLRAGARTRIALERMLADDENAADLTAVQQGVA